jgi:peptide chain release factor subunit 1
LLLSEEFDETMATIKCSNCGYSEKRTIRGSTPQIAEQEISGKPCPNCSLPNLEVIEARDIIDELAEIAMKTGADVELISSQTEEGVSLKESFGGFGAILRFKQ